MSPFPMLRSRVSTHEKSLSYFFDFEQDWHSQTRSLLLAEDMSRSGAGEPGTDFGGARSEAPADRRSRFIDGAGPAVALPDEKGAAADVSSVLR